MSENATPEFFYTTYYLHQWSSGPTMSGLNPERGYQKIESLEEAKELAEKFAVGGYDERRCETTYGVHYKIAE